MHRMIIKRVIGLPGDRISCKDDKVYVNDKALDEPYLDNEWANAIRDTVDAFTEDFTEVCLQEDEYWLMGDNRINSRAVSYTHLDVYKRQIQNLKIHGHRKN